MKTIWGLLLVLLLVGAAQATDFSFSLGIGKATVDEDWGVLPPWTLGATFYPLSPGNHSLYPELVANYWHMQEERQRAPSYYTPSPLDDTYSAYDYGSIDWEAFTTGVRLVLDDEKRQRAAGEKVWASGGIGLLAQWIEPNSSIRAEPTYHADAFLRVGIAPNNKSRKATFIEIEIQQVLDKANRSVPSMQVILKLGHRVSI